MRRTEIKRKRETMEERERESEKAQDMERNDIKWIYSFFSWSLSVGE